MPLVTSLPPKTRRPAVSPKVLGVTQFPETSEASIEINAPIDVVFEFVTDLTRMGEWSPECYAVAWEDGSEGADLGAHFRGFNRVDEYEWDVPGEVTEFVKNRTFEFLVPRGSMLPTTWRFDFVAKDDRTSVRESFHAPMLNLEGSPSNFEGRFEMLHEGIVATLANIKSAAESLSAS